MNVEIYQNGEIIKENIFSPRTFDIGISSSLVSLLNKIKKDGEEGSDTPILEHILAEICNLTFSAIGSISKYSPSGKKLLCALDNQEDEQQIERLEQLDKLVKKFSKRETKILISNDASSDARLKRRRRRTVRMASLPVNVAPKKGFSDTSVSGPLEKPELEEKKRIMIIPIVSTTLEGVPIGQIVLKARPKKIYSSRDVENILLFIRLVERILDLKDEEKTISSAGTDGLKQTRKTNNIKDVFLATVSHELRTPLNGIVGMVTMLKDAGPLNDKQQEYLTILMECSHQLMNMMNNLLDFSKMVSNRMVLLKGPMSISKSVNDAVLMIEGKAKAKSLKFSVDVQDMPILIGDGQRLTQIVSNLLSNAVKYTEKGSIKLKVKGTLEKTNALPYVKKWKIDFYIEDTGIGIPKEEHKKVFEVFHQSPKLDSLMARNGTGLGLSISKELIKMMGGHIKLHSSGIPGKGTIFHFDIITEEEIKMEELEHKHKDIILGSRIMVVDDRPEYRLQLTDMLFKWGCKPIVVSSGEEALQYFSHGVTFDTIIVDICMPYMSGVELAQELKSKEQSKNIPLIALSSVELKDEFAVELFDIYMNKPIDQNYLFPSILECLVKNQDYKTGKLFPKTLLSQRRGSGRLKKEKENLKILIAEDDHNNAFTIKEMLTYLGFDEKNIKIVENGEKCVNEVRKASKTSEAYDVVLMDILMPVMNGLEATKHIRQLNPRPYIVAVSAAVQNSDKQRCQQVGVDSYLIKPVLKEKLDAVLSPLVT